jgi:hypothetical protein
MRYLPIVRLVRAEGLSDEVTEIGSGGVGIAPYLGRPVVGVDTDFGEWQAPLMTLVKGSALALPFADGSRRCVISADMLEHLPSHARDCAIREMVRVTSALLVIAVPSGPGAVDQDRMLDRKYLLRRHERYGFLVEHLDHGLPTGDDLDISLREAFAYHQRRASVSYEWNTNLLIRSLLMRVWIRGTKLSRALLMCANYLHPILSRWHLGHCYRLVATIRFEPEIFE